MNVISLSLLAIFLYVQHKKIVRFKIDNYQGAQFTIILMSLICIPTCCNISEQEEKLATVISHASFLNVRRGGVNY